MRKLSLIINFIPVSLSICARMVLEALTGNKQTYFINYIDTYLDTSPKWKFFGLNQFIVHHKDENLNTISIERQLTYQRHPWIGVSDGGRFNGNLLVPNIGLYLSHLNKKENSIIQMYPTIGILEGKVAPSIISLT